MLFVSGLSHFCSDNLTYRDQTHDLPKAEGARLLESYKYKKVAVPLLQRSFTDWEGPILLLLERDEGHRMPEFRMENKDRILIAIVATLLAATLLSNIGLIMRDASRCSNSNLITPP